MTKFIIQPHGRLNDWVADEKGYFREEGLDYELNVEGSRKNTPPLATVHASGSLADNRFGAFERYAEGHGRKGKTQAMSAALVTGRSIRLRRLKKA